MNRRITRAERIGMIVLAIAIAVLGLALCVVREPEVSQPSVVSVCPEGAADSVSREVSAEHSDPSERPNRVSPLDRSL